MSGLSRVDHAVINVRDAMDAAIERFRALGFTLTDRGYHSLGSINHLMVFDDDYLELVGIPVGAKRVRREIADSPAGLNGLVFATDDAERLHDALAARGVPVGDVVAFHRPVAIDGAMHRASFKTVRLVGDFGRGGRVYFCEHETPQLVWRPEWQAHRNGVHALACVTIVLSDPEREAARYAEVVGGTLARLRAGEGEVRIRDCTVRFSAADRYSSRYGDDACDPHGRDAFMGALALRTSSLARVRECLAAREVSAARSLRDRIIVPARLAYNAVIEFVE